MLKGYRTKVGLRKEIKSFLREPRVKDFHKKFSELEKEVEEVGTTT